MHLLKAAPGELADGVFPVDAAQSPADLVILSSADTELAALSEARAALGVAAPPLRLQSLSALAHPFSVDAYLDATAAKARLVVARVLGGRGYWPYGLEQFGERLGAAGVRFAALPGDDKPDPDLAAVSTLGAADYEALWTYLVEGGPENMIGFLALAAHLLGRGDRPPAAAPLLRAGPYWPGAALGDALPAAQAAWAALPEDAPTAPLVFYRALLQGAGLQPVHRLVDALLAEGVRPLPIFVASLKDPVSAATLAQLFDRFPPDVVLNATAFAVSAAPASAQPLSTPWTPTPLDAPGRAVLQVVFSSGDAATWEEGTRGLSARDIAMHAALPEIDGRLLTRAVSFKGEAYFDADAECAIPAYRARGDRIDFVAKLAGAWARLGRRPAAARRVAMVLANYPDRDGRLANGVGLDAPASAAAILAALRDAGYTVLGAPASGDGVIDALRAGPTNAEPTRPGGEPLPLADYRAFYDALPWPARRDIEARWGAPEADPFFRDDAFFLPVRRFGHVAVGVQPARGYNIDVKETYHAPDLPPPHGYLAFYALLRQRLGCEAVIHLGKHGSLEWLPGKAVALSEACFPEAVFGPTPHLYPFIVNDPGEGAQAKRRAQAVIVDHLTPPMTRAESYGAARRLEGLLDEYYDAAQMDARRAAFLRGEILALAGDSRLDMDAGLDAGSPAAGPTGGAPEEDDADARLAALDAYLCELKEAQIRDGLHVFGAAPEGRQQTDLIAALARTPRGGGEGADASLIRALAADLLDAPDFDPLDCALSAPWRGARPEALAAVSDDPWRSCGDTVERLELLAAHLIAEERGGGAEAPRAAAVLAHVEERIRPALNASGPWEVEALLSGLEGRFVAPGPAGAPTRGRLDVLPTGRNFFSLDSRAVPTPAAWALGWKSAELLIARHLQELGEWPKAIGLTTWGTATMRTGGDDLAQGLALMGARPVWDASGRRVCGVEVIDLATLGRPRVDVTLRVSGFFRDAFPGQIALFDDAARAIMALDEPEADNPAAARFAAERARLVAAGAATAAVAARRASWRVFGAKPGAYGAGLQALIDARTDGETRAWDTAADLADAYLTWGAYAYGAADPGGPSDADPAPEAAAGWGAPARDAFERRLSQVDAVVQNQDNREHDLLDSDDYYQFEGGMTAAAAALSGRAPRVYHNDHSRPERPVIRTLDEEIGRVVRSRAANPKWIAGCKRHGYKGAFEIAATVDYLFAFAAATGAVRDHHFDLVHDAYLVDEETRAFLQSANAPALAEIEARLSEAIDRGLWSPRSNSAAATLGAPPPEDPPPEDTPPEDTPPEDTPPEDAPQN